MGYNVWEKNIKERISSQKGKSEDISKPHKKEQKLKTVAVAGPHKSSVSTGEKKNKNNKPGKERGNSKKELRHFANVGENVHLLARARHVAQNASCIGSHIERQY